MTVNFNPEDTVIFVSILDEDWKCQYDGKFYDIPAHSQRPFRVVVAQHFAKHMADRVLQQEYDVSAIKTKDKEKRARARLWLDPRRYDLYAEMIPELAEVAMLAKQEATGEVAKRPEPVIHASK